MWIKNDGINAKEGYSRRTWFGLDRTRERGDDNASGLGLPERINDGALTPSDNLVVPVPGLGVNGLADRTEDPQRAQVVLFYVLRAETTQEADRRGRRIELCQLVLVDNLPVPRRRRVDGGRLEDRGGGTVYQWPINDITAEVCEKIIKKAKCMNIRVPSDPADISHAGIPVIRLDIEDIFMGQGCAEQVSARRMYDTFRLARGARRLQRVQRRADKYAQANVLT